MKYHPDKNPEGRDMFEKVNKAYEFITAKESR
jgi:DnaJ family protein C protein 13